MIPALLGVHILSAVFWVGGMAFALLMLRPATGALEPAVRLGLWRRTFGHFLPWVGVAIVLLLISGFALMGMLFSGGAPVYVNVMMGVGILMMLLYAHLLFAPWKRFKKAVDGGDLTEGARRLGQIRTLVAVNLVLGIIVIVSASTGRYW